jgi:sulfopropanediol 3-dehydrogenase
VLPSANAARYTAGLSVARFLRPLTYQRIEDDVAGSEIASAVAAISEVEGLAGHGATAVKRLQGIGAA